MVVKAKLIAQDSSGKSETMVSPHNDMPPNFAGLYSDAVEQLRFIKQQQWAVTSHVLAIYGALFGLSRIASLYEPGVLSATILGTMALGLLLLCKMQSGMAKHRRRLAGIYRRFFTDVEREEFELSTQTDVRDWPFLLGLIATMVGGGLIAMVALINAGPP